MEYIEFTIIGKHIVCRRSGVIADNTDYMMRFAFDEGWDGYPDKTVLVLDNESKIWELHITGGATEVKLPKFIGRKLLAVGVTATAGDGEISTDAVSLRVNPSIRTGASEVIESPESGAKDMLEEYRQKYDALIAELQAAIDSTYLGVTGAEVGQTVRITEVAEDGKPTRWEAVDFPSGAFVVNLTMGDDGSITADKTFAEIKAAYDSGKIVMAKFMGAGSVPLIRIGDSIANFQVMMGNQVAWVRCESQDGSDTWDFVSMDMATVDDARSLGITGATAGQIAKIKSVDALGNPTKWEAIEMPSGGTDAVESLGITGASVGQVPIVNSVNENGVPNGWEARDFPSGEVKLIASCTLEETASAIEFTGLNVKNKPISIRIAKTGSASGNGWFVSVNGVARGVLGGSSKSTSGYFDNRIFLLPDGSTLRGVGVCTNGSIFHLSWADFQSPISSIRLTSHYHTGDGTMYYGIGTVVQIYEGIFPNIS